MGKLIQMVKIDAETSLFITGFNENNELRFRTSKMPEYEQYEKVKITGDKVFTNLYFFSVWFLQKFLISVND